LQKTFRCKWSNRGSFAAKNIVSGEECECFVNLVRKSEESDAGLGIRYLAESIASLRSKLGGTVLFILESASGLPDRWRASPWSRVDLATLLLITVQLGGLGFDPSTAQLQMEQAKTRAIANSNMISIWLEK